jgi:two-component system chemotaxis response regulator CheY
MPNNHGILLLVDDDPDWVEALSDVLQEEGYSVVAASNGRVALEKLAKMDPLLVITDIEMPVMGGRQLLSRVRAGDGRVPVIIVSGERTVADDATLAGAFRVMRKPVPLEELLTAITEAGARRIAHLPLNKLWSAAGTVSAIRRPVRTRWRALHELVSPARVAVLALVLAASVGLLVRWRATLA